VRARGGRGRRIVRGYKYLPAYISLGDTGMTPKQEPPRLRRCKKCGWRGRMPMRMVGSIPFVGLPIVRAYCPECGEAV